MTTPDPAPHTPPDTTTTGSINLDAARNYGAHLITRAAYAAVPDQTKARVDLGVTAFASAALLHLKSRLEQLQAFEANSGRDLTLAIQGAGNHAALTLALPPGSGQHAPAQLIIPGLDSLTLPNPNLQHEPNDAAYERIAIARPAAEIIQEIYAPDQTFPPELIPTLRELSIHIGNAETLIIIAMRALTYSPRTQRILMRETMRPLYHLNEAESSPSRTQQTVIGLRASMRLERHYPI